MSSDFAIADTLVIALDIGKNVHWLGCYDGRLNVLVVPHKLRSNFDGFRQMTATVDPLLTSGRFRQAILGYEFTGIYHEPWSWQIHEHYAPYLTGQAACPLTYHMLNPLLTKKRREDNSIRRRSTDRLASWASSAGMCSSSPVSSMTRSWSPGRNAAASFSDTRTSLSPPNTISAPARSSFSSRIADMRRT